MNTRESIASVIDLCGRWLAFIRWCCTPFLVGLAAVGALMIWTVSELAEPITLQATNAVILWKVMLVVAFFTLALRMVFLGGPPSLRKQRARSNPNCSLQDGT